MKIQNPGSCGAVSTVIAAMLILVVITTFVSAINAYYIPSLASENEIQHMQDVRTGFVELSSLAASGTSNEKVLIPLGSEEMPFGPSVSSSGTLTVDSNSSWINISMEKVAEPQKELNSTNLLNNLSSVSTLYLVKEADVPVDSLSYDIIVNGDAGNRMRAEWEDQNTLVLGVYKSGIPVFFKYVSTPLVRTEDYFALDLLDPVYGFKDILEDAETPFSLWLEGSYFIEYEKLPPYTYDEIVYVDDKFISIPTGSFSYSSSNNFWIDQDYIFENGAVILKQSTSNETLFRSKPFISLDEDGKLLNMQIFNIVGVDDSMSGNGVSTVNLQVEQHEEQVYPYVENITLEIDSEYSDAWKKYMDSMNETVNNTLNYSSEINGSMLRTSFYNKSVKISMTDVKVIIP